MRAAVVLVLTFAIPAVAADADRKGPTEAFKCRFGESKAKLLERWGGTKESEAAVDLGLQWLAAQQKPDGRWAFDGSATGEVIAATGMSLLPFLAAGHTDVEGRHAKSVAAGLRFLIAQQNVKGTFEKGTGMYAHAIATTALCEAYGMTQSPDLKKPARAALDYILTGQGPDGSWGYAWATEGDTSITGWQIQALRAGQQAGLVVPKETWGKVTRFLDSVSGGAGESYGYREKGASRTLTPVGLLGRQYTGWGRFHPILERGVKILTDKYPPKQGGLDMYYHYYATQVVHFWGRNPWEQKWNDRMRNWLLELQERKEGPNRGSWDADQGIIGAHCGRLGTTALALLTLEVYYRHFPIYKHPEPARDDPEP